MMKELVAWLGGNLLRLVAVAWCVSRAAGTCTCDTAAQPDCTGLTDLYLATGGAGWTSNAGWCDGADYCAWDGVTCTGTSIVGLDRSSNGLTGSLPDGLGALVTLTSLSLSSNSISGSVPAAQLAGLTRLVNLIMHENSLTGTLKESLLALTALNELCLITNSLSGTLPSGLTSLSRLQALYFGSNRFSGTIPATYEALTAVTAACLHSTDISGTVPASLSSLTRLGALIMHGRYERHGRFSGTLSEAFGAWTSMETLTINNNKGLVSVLYFKWQLGDQNAASDQALTDAMETCDTHEDTAMETCDTNEDTDFTAPDGEHTQQRNGSDSYSTDCMELEDVFAELEVLPRLVPRRGSFRGGVEAPAAAEEARCTCGS